MTTPQAVTYSFLDVSASITGPGGSFLISGQGTGAAEEGVTLEMHEDKNTMTLGADGTPMHSLHAANAARLVVRLLKTSPINAQLSSLYATQTQSSSLHGQNTVTIKNPVSGDSITATGVAFKKFPTNNYAKVGGLMEWDFDVGFITQSLGGGGQIANTVALVTGAI